MKTREEKAEYARKWRENHKEELKEYFRRYNEDNKEKRHEYGRQYRENNQERLAANQRQYYKTNREKILASARQHKLRDPEHRYLTDKKNRCKKEGIAWDLERGDLVFPSHCPVLDIELEWTQDVRGPSYNSYSLDRIDPNEGYVKGNVIVVSMQANRIKSNATVDQIQAVADFYRELNNKGDK